MTDRINSITLVLDQDIREDDAQSLITACHAFRGVVSVDANVADYQSHVAQQRVRRELGTALMAVLCPDGGRWPA